MSERDDGQRKPLPEGDDSGFGTTIVGGQPPGRRRHSLKGVPVGVERALFVAADEPDFRDRLLRDPEAAVAERGIALRDSELAMLRAIPAARLRATIDSIDTSPSNVARRGFMRVVAAGAVSLAAVEACSENVDGIRPDAVPDYPAPTGVRPDMPELGPESADAAPEAAEPADGGAEASDGLAADLEADLAAVTGIRPDGGE